jgi:hypothetical protein
METIRVAKLGLSGGLVFWLVTIVDSLLPIAGQFRAAVALPYIQVLVGSLVAGIVLGLCVSCALVFEISRSPSRSALVTAVALSLGALVLVEPLIAFARRGDELDYILVGAALDFPRFLLLGVGIGYLSSRL